MEKGVIIATHNGRFHPDDVFAVAILLLVLESLPVIVQIERTRDESRIALADFVVDVGNVYDAEKNRFDHHQEGGAGKRENGMPFASFGLVWRKFGAKLCGDNAEVAEIVERKLIEPLDAGDNGQDIFKPTEGIRILPYLIDDFIYSLTPTWLEKVEDFDENFSKAVGFARVVIEREIKCAEALAEGKKKVLDAYKNAEDKRIVVLDNYYPWQEILMEKPEPLFVIFPRERGDGWNVKAIRENIFSFKDRKSFPESWAGKRDFDLAQITGVDDATFCHTARFMAVAKSREGATALAKLAVSSPIHNS